mgnify:FL=1
MPLSWACFCGRGHVYHVWDTERCPRCGAIRDDMVRAERARQAEGMLSEAERAALERLHERWTNGECD